MLIANFHSVPGHSRSLIVVVDHHSFSFHAISDHIGKLDNGLLAPQLLFIFLEFLIKVDRRFHQDDRRSIKID
jgi:hypothetical protein